MEQRAILLVLLLLGLFSLLAAGFFVNAKRAEAARARDAAVMAREAAETRASEPPRGVELPSSEPADETRDAPADGEVDARSERTPVVAPDTVAARVSELERLVDGLLVEARADDDDAPVAREGLRQAWVAIQELMREEERARREREQEEYATVRSASARAKGWIDDATQLADPAKRDRAIASIRGALDSTDPEERHAALRALAALGDVNYDKAQFRAPLLAILETAKGTELSSALYALANTDKRPEDLALALRAIDDPGARSSASHLVFVFGGGDATGATGDALMALFETDDASALRSALQGLWGAEVSPKIAARVLELSRSPNHELAHDAIYFGLSTWRNKSPEVVARLIEVLSDPDFNNSGRALWGLGHGVPSESWPTVADAMRDLFEARSDARSRTTALDLIGAYGSATHVDWLAALRDDPDASSDLREAAKRALERILTR